MCHVCSIIKQGIKYKSIIVWWNQLCVYKQFRGLSLSKSIKVNKWLLAHKRWATVVQPGVSSAIVHVNSVTSLWILDPFIYLWQVSKCICSLVWSIFVLWNVELFAASILERGYGATYGLGFENWWLAWGLQIVLQNGWYAYLHIVMMNSSTVTELYVP